MTERQPRRFRIPHPGWLLLAGLVLAVIAGALIVWNRPSLRAIRMVERLGGKVNTEPAGPRWLRQLLGRRYGRVADRLVGISLRDSAVTDADLKQLSGLTSLRELILERSKRLRSVDGLGGLPDLQTLNLNFCTALTNVNGLKHLTTLKTVYLNGCPQLRDLDGLKNLKGLEYVSVFGARQLTDIDGLSGLTKVEVLNLSNCDQITDFTPVQGMTGLRELNLKGCPLTAEEIAALREALPTTVVIFFPKNAVSGFEPKTQ